MKITRSILEKAASMIASHVICRLGEESRSNIEELVNEAFKAYEALKAVPPKDKVTILELVKTEVIRTRKHIENWGKM